MSGEAKQAVLFLNGRYSVRDFSRYKSLCRNKLKVAVDGGIRFFISAKLKPDLIIGDFDSSRISPEKLKLKFPKAEVLVFPEDKDKTDSQLAIDTCFEHGIYKIDLVQPSFGELDHLLGNLMLLTKFQNKSGSHEYMGRLIGPAFEASLIDNDSVRIIDKKSWRLSIVPLSKRIKLSCKGLKYPAAEVPVKQGESRSLRNLVTGKSAHVSIKGQAFMILQKS